MTESSPQQTNHAAETAKKLVGLLAKYMGGYIFLVATLLVWIAWFFLPAISINTFYIDGSFTFWNLVNADFGNTFSGLNSGSVGIMGFIGMMAIIAPFIAPLLKFPWAKYLYAAPLGFVVLYGLRIWLSVGSLVGSAQRVSSQVIPGGGNIITSASAFSVGLYVLLIASAILASRTLMGGVRKQSH